MNPNIKPLERDIQLLRSVFSYCKETGELHWIKGCGTAGAGSSAGSIDGYGYRKVMFAGVTYRAHRLVWAIVHGEPAKGFIDHINHNKLDNRVENLREVSKTENLRNMKLSSRNTSGVSGVWLCKKTNKWRAEIRTKGKKHCLGRFESIEEAQEAREKAKINLGFHENHGLA